VALAGGDAWVADGSSTEVARVDVATGKVRATVSVGRSPIGIAADARDVYVICRDDRTLVRVDARTGQVQDRVTLPGDPTAIALDPAHVWVAAGNRDIIRVDR
jgi:YVTN family beta-propeller protein